MAVKQQEQASFEEELLEDADLEAVLNQRQTLKEAAATAHGAFVDKDEEARGRVAGFELPTGKVLRCGAFRLSTTSVPAGHRSFDTKPRTRISIRHVKEE